MQMLVQGETQGYGETMEYSKCLRPPSNSHLLSKGQIFYLPREHNDD